MLAKRQSMSLFGDVFGDFDEIFGAVGDIISESSSPQYKISVRSRATASTTSQEKDGRYIYSVELPGYKPEEVELTVTDTVLSVVAKRDGSTKKSTSFSLPSDANTSDVTAKLALGILTISVAKTDVVKSKSRKVVIGS